MITRSPRRKSFTVIDNDILNDVRLGADAVGLLVYLLSKPDNWQVRSNHLMARFNCGKHKIYVTLKELRKCGYAEYQRLETGETDWTISETRMDEPYAENQDKGKKPHPKNPDLGFPDLDNQDVLVSTERAVNTDRNILSDSDESDAFEEIWKSKPNRPNQSKAKTKKAYNARIREDVPHADLLAGLLRYTAHVKAQGTAPQFQKQLSTFLGTARDWEQPWAVAEKVPESLKEVQRFIRLNNIPVQDGASLDGARKEIAAATGMSL